MVSQACNHRGSCAPGVKFFQVGTPAANERSTGVPVGASLLWEKKTPACALHVHMYSNAAGRASGRRRPPPASCESASHNIHMALAHLIALVAISRTSFRATRPVVMGMNNQLTWSAKAVCCCHMPDACVLP